MNSIQTIMLIGLGFLTAALIVSLWAPAYRRRTVRLTTEAIKRAMPLTEAEIRADKDRLRAEYAITIHRLEMKLTEANLAAARQLVDLNRRDANISRLEGDVARLRTSLDEHENARRVLEQTVTDRLPKVESRLAEAKKMLFQRDREISALSQSAQKQTSALEETTQINTQQRDEIHRLNAALATRAARNRESLGDSRFDGEVALRSEIEALRAKARDSAAQVARLQSLLARRGGLPGDGADKADLNGAAHTADAAEMERLRRALTAAEARLSEAAASVPTETSAFTQQIEALKAAAETQAAEIARLKASLAVYEASTGESRGEKDDRITLKAELGALKAADAEHVETIQRLRAEVAAANERLARQSSHFRDEMRRLGAGTLPAAGEAVRAGAEPAERRTLSSRIAEPRMPRMVPVTPGASVEAAATEPRGSNGMIGESKPLAANDQSADPGQAPDRRPRLMERITGADKS